MTERHGSGRMSPHSDEPQDSGDVLGRVREQLQTAVNGIVTELENAGSSGSRANADAIDALLRRLLDDVGEIKLELQRARSERLEDLTLVVDLLTTSWRAVERRLERIDRNVERFAGRPGHGIRPPSRLP